MELDLGAFGGFDADSTRPKRARVGRAPDEILGPIDADTSAPAPERALRELLLYLGRPAQNRLEPLLDTRRAHALELDTAFDVDARMVLRVLVEACVRSRGRTYARARERAF